MQFATWRLGTGLNPPHVDSKGQARTAVVEDICHGREAVVEQHIHLVLARSGLVPRQLLGHL